MPTLDAVDTGSAYTKLLMIGDSGTGKTCALASLIKAGYHVGFLDLDNKLASSFLPKLLTPEEQKRVRVMAFRDKEKMGPNGPMPIKARAFRDAMDAIDKWDDGTDPAAWGPGHIFVLDSLTFLGKAAYNWAQAMNPTYKNPQLWYGDAQKACETVLAQLTSDSFQTHVIVISHIKWTEREDGSTKGYPTAIGKALGPTIPSYFNTMISTESRSSNTGTKDAERVLRCIPNTMLDLKTTMLELPEKGILPQATGLATFFDQAGAKPVTAG